MRVRTNLRRCRAVGVALFCLAAVFWEQAKGAETVRGSAHALPVIRYEKYRLRNGLDVILSEDHTLPMVSVNIWYHVGPANERPGRTGFAHLFEHMMFQGSAHVGAKAHFRYLESAGASSINGTTSFDRTNYFETVPSNQLELALWLESDRMGYLLPTLDREKLANQRDVVRNERRQSIENAPYGLVEEELFHQLFPKGHPYYANVIGSHADIESARLGDVREFFWQYYSPNNASIAIVGDFDRAQAKTLVEKYFGSLPRGPAVPKMNVVTPRIVSERRAIVTDQVELPRVYMAWFAPPIYQPGDAESDLLAQILGGGKTSRLYRKLVYEKQIAQSVSANNDSLALGSVFTIEATAKAGVKAEDLEKAVDEELAEFRKNGPSKEELERASNVLETGTVRWLESFGAVANRLNQYNHYLGDPGYLAKDLARYENVSPGDLRRLCKRELASSARVVVYGIPGKRVVEDVPKTTREEEAKGEVETTVGTSAPDEAWRANPPRPGAAPEFVPPVPASFELKNGLKVFLVERHKLPLLSARIVVLRGSAANPAGKPGLASFTAEMLNEGTWKHTGLELAEAAEQIGGTLRAWSNYDGTTVSLDALTRNAGPALALLSEVALDPAFDEKETERKRSQRLTALAQESDSPSALRTKTLSQVLYGNGAYGYDTLGTPESNRTITRDDLVNFWKREFVPSNAALVVSGDVTGKELQALAEMYFGSWNAGSVMASAPPAPPSPSRAIYIVDKPGAPQTSLVVGTVGASRSTPDYVPLEVLNMIFGGEFSSRINMNLREEHGYTYGAHSAFSFRRGAGPFSAWAELRTDATAPALAELFREIKRIREAEVSAEELQRAKDAWALSLAGDFATTNDLASTTAGEFIYGLPAGYYVTLPAQINAVTAADVERVAQKYLNPEAMVVVAVGDRKRIEPELAKLGLGPVTIVP